MKFLVALFGVFFATSAIAQEAGSSVTSLPIDSQRPALNIQWSITDLTNRQIPSEIVPDNRERPRNGLPDGRIAVAEERGDIREAWYTEPTRRYRHAVLGDEIEAGALKVRTFRGLTYTFRLPRSQVFEDITPRIADLDDDGTNEVIAILSSASQGASVAVFGLNGNAFIMRAQSEPIGRSNRWLNIAGIDHFASNRSQQVAIIETPHLAGYFKTYFFDPGSQRLQTNMRVPGFSNHEIGSRELRLSATTQLDNDGLVDLVVPSLDRRTLFIVSPTRRGLRLLTKTELPARVNRAIAATGQGRELELVVGLDDGRIYALKQEQQ